MHDIAALTASALRAGELLGLAIANLITLFAPLRVVLVGTAFALGEPLMTALRGAAAAALKELYGAPWSTTGPARPRNSTTETGHEAE